jgi:serine/threonine-protein kinase
MPLLSGDKLGPYEILSPIGSGGMGEVYKAADTRLGRTVAIKTFATDHVGRFEKEARAIAALNHPHICQLYDIGPNYLVMEFIEGTILHGPLPMDQVFRYAAEICEALDAAHRKNITHRDLKPANILITARGVKLLDFGLAKMATDQEGHLDTSVFPSPQAAETIGFSEVGSIIGTAAYMSPEQAKGERADTRSDIFSFGLVLYQMISGRQAFTGNSPIETMAAIVRDEPAPLNAPTKVGAIVQRCLRKSPVARYQTIQEVKTALEQAEHDHSSSQRRPLSQNATESIAVLPFANLTSDKENEYFSDGLAEEILNLLTRIPGLKVIARTSSFAFRGKDLDIRKIAGTLGVNNILEGSVRRSGNRLRVSAQLIHATDGTHLWAERYDRDMTDIFAIQDEIGQAISEALQVRLAPRSQTINIEAYQNYLKGQYHRARYTPESLAKAKEYFERALAIDPNYAPAYGGLAAYYYLLAGLAMKPPSEVSALAKSAAERALALDPAQTEARSVLASMAAGVDYDWKAAEKHFHEAMSIDPVPPTVRLRYVLYYLLAWHRIPEAITQSRLALETDPLAMIMHFGMALSLYQGRQYQQAIDYSHRALEIDANFYLMWLILGASQLGAGSIAEGVASLEKAAALAPWYSLAAGYLASALHQAGDYERAQELGRKLQSWQGGNFFGAAIYFAAAGDRDAMYAALHNALNQRDWELRVLGNLERFENYRNEPRLREILQQMNLA